MGEPASEIESSGLKAQGQCPFGMQTEKQHLDGPRKQLLLDQQLRLTVGGGEELLPVSVSKGTALEEAWIVTACLTGDCVGTKEVQNWGMPTVPVPGWQKGIPKHNLSPMEQN